MCLEGLEGGESLYSPHLAEGWLTKIPFTTDLVWLLTLRADGRCGTLGEMNPAAASTSLLANNRPPNQVNPCNTTRCHLLSQCLAP